MEARGGNAHVRLELFSRQSQSQARLVFMVEFVPPQCHPSGCLTDLFIQMAIIMVLKQTISNIFEFTGPYVQPGAVIGVCLRCARDPHVCRVSTAGSTGGCGGGGRRSCRGNAPTVT